MVLVDAFLAYILGSRAYQCYDQTRSLKDRRGIVMTIYITYAHRCAGKGITDEDSNHATRNNMTNDEHGLEILN